MRGRPLHILIALFVTAFLVTACGSGTSTNTTKPATTTTPNMITIQNFAFSPTSLTVAPGATVTVKNADTATHTVTASDKAFDTGNVTSGATKTFTAPNKPGTYTYICDIHQYMQGTLIVK